MVRPLLTGGVGSLLMVTPVSCRLGCVSRADAAAPTGSPGALSGRPTPGPAWPAPSSPAPGGRGAAISLLRGASIAPMAASQVARAYSPQRHGRARS
jgi:hypothetical protein